MNKQLIRKKKLSSALALALGLGLAATGGTALAVELDNNDRLGDAGVFQYYTVNGGWQTFIRIINTSDYGASVKVRFREAANSREVLDFTVFLSPYDMWVGWTDPDALENGKPGIRTRDTSCIYPNTGNSGGQSFRDVPSKGGAVRGASFENFAYTGPHYDDGNSNPGRATEGHVEVIGIAQHAPGDFTSAITHADEGELLGNVPANCSAAAGYWLAGTEGADGMDMGNVLAMNGYLINISTGQGAGFDPDILTNFTTNSLWLDQALTATDPDFDSGTDYMNRYGHPATTSTFGKQKGYVMGVPTGPPWFGGLQDVTGSVDEVSRVFQRASVINEWAASPGDAGNITQYFSQWILTFPTKHYYVDLQDDTLTNDDISPTLSDPCEPDSNCPNDAIAPFAYEFDEIGNGASCEPYAIRMWNREERDSSWTSPQGYWEDQLCYETNVLVFNEDFLEEGLASNFATTVPSESLPLDTNSGLFSDHISERGWASLDFYRGFGFAPTGAPAWIGTGVGFEIEQNRHLCRLTSCAGEDLAGLPVTGFMFSVFNTNLPGTNHTTANAHKYRRQDWSDGGTP